MENSKKKFSVWISWCHSEDNKKHVEALTNELKANAAEDVNVIASRWFEESNFGQEVHDGIQESDAYVLLVSDGFPTRRWIKEELQTIKVYGCEPNREIFLLLVESCELPKVEAEDKSIFQEILEKETRQLESLGDAKSPQYENMRDPLTYKDMALKILKRFKKIKDDGPLSEYADAIKKGLFVPYIGPDCYGLRDEWQPHLETLRARLGNIRKRVGAVSAPENLEANREYLKAVVISHNPDLDAQEQLQGGAVSGEEAVGDLFELRVSVALAGAAASRLLGKSLSRCKGLLDAKAYRVNITEVDDPDVQILKDALWSAKESAHECNAVDFCPMRGGEGKDCMGPHHIEEKLGLFLGAVFTGHEREAAVRKVHLSLAQLDWLGDLLWHLMRFDLPIFPKPDELAFRLALCQNTKYFARIPFGTTAAIWAAAGNGEGKQAESPVDIANCSDLMHCKLGELRRSNPTHFYRAIAKLLWNSFQWYTKMRKTMPKPDSAGPGYKAAEEAKIIYPIVVSMNFDEELENCLHHTDYSVLHPARLPRKDETIWLLRVHEHKRGKDQYYLFPMDTKCSGEIIESKLRGPLIVKYRGSLRHNTNLLIKIQPIHGELQDGSSKAEPSPLLSTFEHVKRLSALGQVEPPWLGVQLAQERVKCFLGYPLDDIDGILGIQRNVWITSEGVQNELLSIGCRHRDGLDSELLTGLRVKPLKVALNDFADAVNKLIYLDDLPPKGD